VCIITCGVGNLPINFGVSRTFHSLLIGQHLSDVSRDLATLIFDLGGHGACQWCGSSCSVAIPSLKFLGLPFQTILRIYYVSINRPGDLDLLTSKFTIYNAPLLSGRGHNKDEMTWGMQCNHGFVHPQVLLQPALQPQDTKLSMLPGAIFISSNRDQNVIRKHRPYSVGLSWSGSLSAAAQ